MGLARFYVTLARRFGILDYGLFRLVAPIAVGAASEPRLAAFSVRREVASLSSANKSPTPSREEMTVGTRHAAI